MLRLLAFFKIVELIWLQDYAGETHLTIKRRDAFGNYYCYVYPLNQIGYVTLYENGSCGGKSLYIMKWKNYKS